MTARDMDANIARALGMSTNWQLDMIARLLFQKVYKTMQFLVMNSRVYQQHTRNKFMSLLHLKGGRQKRKHRAKECERASDSNVCVAQKSILANSNLMT